MEENNQDVKKMDKNKKTAIAVLSVFSVLIIVMGFINFRQSLREPLALQGGTDLYSNKSSQNCVDGSCSVGDLNSSNLELKLIDTDNDGISDWDELFIYSTSPYLEDTDGDGLTDYEEIFTYKTNPNCPEGQVCSGSLVREDNQNIIQSNSDDLLSFMESWDDYYYESELGVEQLSDNLKPENMSAAYIRELLLEAGISKENLDTISDNDLMLVYQEVLSDF